MQDLHIKVFNGDLFLKFDCAVCGYVWLCGAQFSVEFVLMDHYLFDVLHKIRSYFMCATTDL